MVAVGKDGKNKMVFTSLIQIKSEHWRAYNAFQCLGITMHSIRVLCHWKVDLIFRKSQKSLKLILLLRVKQINSF